MPDMIPIARDELSRLEERARKLATDKSYLQLVIRLMTKVSDASGLEDTIHRILHNITDVVGGTNIALYYLSNNEILYEDVLGQKRRLDRIEDELVQRVFTSREVVEFEHDFSATRMTTPEFTKAYTWVYPLMVGPEIIGVIKLESLHLRMREMYQHLPAFFSFVALVLKNEIAGLSRLKQAYAALEQEVTVRKHAEAGLLRVNETLEERVAERTRELQSSNEQARRINRELQAISNCNQVLMRAVDEQALLNDICGIVCEQAGYRMAWVGYAENDTARTVRPVAWAGVEDGYLAQASITWAGTERGRGPTGAAIRSGASQCIDDFATDPRVAPWREPALQRGYRSSLALPLKDESARVFGAITIYATETNAFPPEEMRLLEELAGDLAFGIRVLRGRIERAETERRLKASEERLRLTLEATGIGIWDWDVQHDRWYASPIYYTMLGYAPLEGAADRGEWMERVHPDDRATVREKVQNVQTKDFDSYEYEARMRHANGNYRWINVAGFGIERDSAGRVTRLLGIRMDVTERRQAQERLAHLAAIVESSDDAIIGKALDETIVSWNRGAERIYGYTAGEIVGCPISILIPPGLQEELATIMDGIKRGEGVEHLETTRVRKDGQTIQVALTISPIRDARGQIVGASTIARDITERKRAEAEMRARNEELTRFNQTATGRELRMIELKQEINELCRAAGQPPRYKLDFVKTATTPPP
jgi:PAS domain S-box-containing protein